MADEESPAKADEFSSSEDSVSESDPLLPKQTQPKMAQVLIYVAASFLIIVGVLAGMYIEKMHFLTALYVVIQIITTIGYGDFTVQSEEMKFFCSMYVVLVLVLAAYAANFIVDAINERSHTVMTGQLVKLESSTLLEEKPEGELPQGVSQLSHHELMRLRRKFDASMRRYNKLISASTLALAFILIGVVFYATYEGCSCSYGKSAVSGCVDDTYELCARTGGFKKTWIDCFYMSVITLTTVGFGDHTPRSKLGRAMAVPWMLLGVACVANWVNEVRHFFFEEAEKKKHHKTKGKHSREMFSANNLSRTGRLTKAEYRCYMLQRMGMVRENLFQNIDAHFDHLEAESGFGGVSFEALTGASRSHVVTLRSQSMPNIGVPA